MEETRKLISLLDAMVRTLSHGHPVTAQLGRWQGAHPSGLRDPDPCSLGDRPETPACLLSVLGTSVDATLCPATLDGFFFWVCVCIREAPESDAVPSKPEGVIW